MILLKQRHIEDCVIFAAKNINTFGYICSRTVKFQQKRTSSIVKENRTALLVIRNLILDAIYVAKGSDRKQIYLCIFYYTKMPTCRVKFVERNIEQSKSKTFFVLIDPLNLRRMCSFQNAFETTYESTHTKSTVFLQFLSEAILH